MTDIHNPTETVGSDQPSTIRANEAMTQTRNPTETVGSDGRVRVRAWAAGAREPAVHAQAAGTALARGVVLPVALMPDAHVGIGACVGSVVATEGSIIPSTVGVDIGCGMSAVRLDIDASKLPDDLGRVLAAFERAVPTMRHKPGRPTSEARAEALRWFEANPVPSGREHSNTAGAQLGTLGGGNHFLELSTDTRQRTWIVVHSGSRGVGNKLANQHIRIAAACDDAAHHRDLAALAEGSAEFAAYVADMQWCQEYAFQNREAMLAAAVDAFVNACELPRGAGRPTERIRCHHNYAARERHHGRDVWVTRKGAIRARAGDKGIIPGSMGTSTFIVEGLGNPASWCSAAHGAGRLMSRRQAKDQISEADLHDAMSGRVWLEHRAGNLRDEAPQAYKDIHAVMDAQRDLCRATEELTALVNYKGTRA